ncbi:MAG: helix-turn-helix domain containing protein [Bacteroidota bacterium]
MKKHDQILYIEGKRKLPIKPDDKLAVKFAMLFEATCSIGIAEALKKYGYTEQRFYQLLKAYEEQGTDGLIDKKQGPKTNRVRSNTVNNQIIRYRFLDPNSSPAVIAQKMRQDGYTISESSVARTIAEYGLQKKTSINLILKRKRKK